MWDVMRSRADVTRHCLSFGVNFSHTGTIEVDGGMN
jgi:hypothetical protein